MATELHDKLSFINEEKNKKILPENIKKGVKIFNVEGVADVLDTSDANATASDILQGKSAYVQGTKVEGVIPSIETVKVTPKMDEETIYNYNSYIGNVQIPSILDVAGGENEVSVVGSVMAGGTRTTSVSATVNTVPGGMIVALLHYRSAKQLSGEGWTSVAVNQMITAENYYQWAEVVVKSTTETSEKVTMTTTDANGRIAIDLISYDTMCPIELIHDYVSGPTRVSRSPSFSGIKKGDILLAHNFWTSSGCYINGVSLHEYRRCSDGSRFAVGIAAGNSDDVYFSNDSTSELGGMVLRLNPALTADDIKVGRKILGITGTFTADADAKASDIMTGKTAYVNGAKITGKIATLGDEVQVSATDASVNDTKDKFIISSVTPASGVLSQGATYQITANGQQVVDALGLAPDLIRAGVNVLGVEGTYGADVGEFNAKYETDGLTSGLTPSVLITTIQGMNTEGVISANTMFSGLTRLKSLPEMNLSSVTTMGSMCLNCSNLIYAPNYDIPNCTSMVSSFFGCNNLSSINFTNSNKVTDFTQTFMNCFSMKNIPIMNYSGASSYVNTFSNSGISNTIDMSIFNRINIAYSFTNTFRNCLNVTKVENFIKLGTGYPSFIYTYQNCANLLSVNDCQFLNTQNTYMMFHNCWNLREMNNCIWTFPNPNYYSSYNNHYHMFGNCTNLIDLGESFWTNLKVSQMNYMFYNCQNLRFPKDWVLNIWGYNFYNSNMYQTFFNCHYLENITLHYTNITTSGTTYYTPQLGYTFNGCSNLHTVNIHNVVMNYNYYFTSGRPFTNCPNLTNIIFSNVRFKNNATTGVSFAGLASGSGITSINNVVGLNLFETNQCTHMFSGCKSLYDLGSEYMNFWRVNNFNDMFADCINLKSINQNQINMNNALYINAMFAGCKMNNFENWNWPKVTMATYLFSRSNLGYVNNIDLPACTNAYYLFAESNIDTIGEVTINKITSGYFMFNNACINCIDGLNLPALTTPYYLFYNARINSINNLQLPNLRNYGSFFNYCYIKDTKCINQQTFPNITNAQLMFANSRIEHLKDVNLVINGAATQMFMNSRNLLTINNVVINTNSTTCPYMFQICYNLQEVDGFSFSNQMNMYQMFVNCNSLVSVNNITAPIGSGTMTYAFQNCTALQTAHNLSFPFVTSMSYTFYQCSSLYSVTGLNFANCTTAPYTFHLCNNLRTLEAMDCSKFLQCNTILGYMYNLENFGGFINLGQNFWTNSQYNSYQYLYLNFFPNLTQQSLFNIVNGLAKLVNYSNIYVTQNQYNLLDSEHRSILSNKHWRLNRLSV